MKRDKPSHQNNSYFLALNIGFV